MLVCLPQLSGSTYDERHCSLLITVRQTINAAKYL